MFNFYPSIIEYISDLAECLVIRANQNAPRPDGKYCTIQLVRSDSDVSNMTKAVDANGNVTNAKTFDLFVNINVYGESNDHNGANVTAQKIIDGLENTQKRRLTLGSSLVFKGVETKPLDATEVFAGDYQPRVYMTLKMHAYEDVTFFNGVIENVEMTSNVNNRNYTFESIIGV